jgi:hypothetical protein
MMKHVAALICLGLLFIGVFWIEYQTVLLLGTAGFIFPVGSALALLGIAVARAPEGRERRDGFHLRLRERRESQSRWIRFSQRARARQ